MLANQAVATKQQPINNTASATDATKLESGCKSLHTNLRQTPACTFVSCLSFSKCRRRPLRHFFTSSSVSGVVHSTLRSKLPNRAHFPSFVHTTRFARDPAHPRQRSRAFPCLCIRQRKAADVFAPISALFGGKKSYD